MSNVIESVVCDILETLMELALHTLLSGCTICKLSHKLVKVRNNTSQQFLSKVLCFDDEMGYFGVLNSKITTKNVGITYGAYQCNVHQLSPSIAGLHLS